MKPCLLSSQKQIFGKHYGHLALNERQTKLLNKLLDGIDGKMTTAKWAKIAKCSQDTAYRDILALIDVGVLKKSEAGGRSTGYVLSVQSSSEARLTPNSKPIIQ